MRKLGVNCNKGVMPGMGNRSSLEPPLSVDLNATFVINKLYMAGSFTRQLNTYGLLIQAVVSNFRLGYVFEVPGNGSMGFSTHE